AAGLTTRFEVQTAAAVTTAPASTCPWVHAGANGTTLVRNYIRGPSGRPATPMEIARLEYTRIFLQGDTAPFPWLLPRSVPRMFVPPPPAAGTQALLGCPFGDVAGEAPPSGDL